MRQVDGSSIPCGACRAPLFYGVRHSGLGCWWRCWRYYRKTGLDPMTRWMVESTPPEQVTTFAQPAEGDSLTREFRRARERWAQLPQWARPVITRPPGTGKGPEDG